MINELIKKHKLDVTLLGDIIVFFLSITITLYLRYGADNFAPQLQVHIEPFIIVLVIWLIIFYISNLYTYKAFKNTLEIIRSLTTAVVINLLLTITIFYIFSRFFSLTPKFNLVIVTIIFWGLDLLWRYSLRKIFIKKDFQYNVLIISSSPLVTTIKEYAQTNPQLGYYINLFNPRDENLLEIIRQKSINMVVVDSPSLEDKNILKTLYSLFQNKIEIVMFTDFYESLFNCIPLSEIEEEWFIKEIYERRGIYESIRQIAEIILAFVILIISIPFDIIIGILVKISSKGPIIYKQKRMGKNNKPFTFYKFRTMKINNGPLWTLEEDDRITHIGKFLRYTHLDEIPQLINVIKGDISFIGPRPESVELVKSYEKIPYYEIRHTIKPGITGWAQLNYKASSSIEEAEKKFQFDLYYIKNRSLALDIFILIKTIRTIF